MLFFSRPFTTSSPNSPSCTRVCTRCIKRSSSTKIRYVCSFGKVSADASTPLSLSLFSLSFSLSLSLSFSLLSLSFCLSLFLPVSSIYRLLRSFAHLCVFWGRGMHVCVCVCVCCCVGVGVWSACAHKLMMRHRRHQGPHTHSSAATSCREVRFLCGFTMPFVV